MQSPSADSQWQVGPRGFIELGEVDSTNTWCLAQSAALASGTMVVAEAQSAGRGRHGRTWYSPPGCNLYASILLKAPLPGPGPAALSQIAALAIHDTLTDEGVEGVWIKWPNDVFVEQNKIAGVLGESRWRANQVDALVIGMGVNLNMEAADVVSIGQPATSVRVEIGRSVDRLSFASTLYRSFNEGLCHLQQWGGDSLFQRWRQASRLLGREVTVHESHGQRRGRVSELRRDGALEITTPAGERRVYHYGEVSIRLAKQP